MPQSNITIIYSFWGFYGVMQSDIQLLDTGIREYFGTQRDKDIFYIFIEYYFICVITSIVQK